MIFPYLLPDLLPYSDHYTGRRETGQVLGVVVEGNTGAENIFNDALSILDNALLCTGKTMLSGRNALFCTVSNNFAMDNLLYHA